MKHSDTFQAMPGLAAQAGVVFRGIARHAHLETSQVSFVVDNRQCVMHGITGAVVVLAHTYTLPRLGVENEVFVMGAAASTGLAERARCCGAGSRGSPVNMQLVKIQRTQP